MFALQLSNAHNAVIANTQALATIIDNDESPQLAVEVSPNILWPPNHKMVLIEPIIQVSDDHDSNPVVKIESITSNQEANGSGDGNTNLDFLIADDGQIYLRAERNGNGTERIYTLTFSATDSAGNITYTDVLVTVPHDLGKDKSKKKK